MKILLNYADGKFLESQFKNSQTGLAAGFNVVYQMNRSEIDPDFYTRHSDILNQRRGVGYWLWKPYFIQRILKTMNNDDILFYADSGSVFVRRMEPIFNAVRSDERGVLCFTLAGKHSERLWTKRDLFLHMGMYSSEYTDSPQRMASFMCFRGTDFARELLTEYLYLATNAHLVTDSPNSDGWIEPDFKDHRHDQSVWSLLTKKHGVTILPDPTQWGVQHGENTEEHQYIFHTRDPR